MRMIVRPYNNDGPRLASIAASTTRVGGIMFDAHITKFAANMTKRAQQTMGPEAEFFIDPVTHKINRPFYRAKPSSFQQLDYFFYYPFGRRGPSIDELSARAKDGAQKLLMHQQYFKASSLIAPYFFLDSTQCSSRAGTLFGAMKKWSKEFAALKSDQPITLSLCLAADCLVAPKSLLALEEFVRDHQPKAVYLLLFDWEIDGSEAVTKGVLTFLERLREIGVQRIIYSHAPPWIYYLAPRGVTDFVSGINYLTTLKREFLDREEDLKSDIPQNYYIPMRFCKMTPADAQDAIDRQLIWPCDCPACHGLVPTAKNLIKEHYVHARVKESERLGAAGDRQVELLQNWACHTEEFLVKAQENALKVMGNPNPSRWKALLPLTAR